MTKDKVLKAAFCIYTDGYFEAHCPFLPHSACAGDTEQEAMQELRKRIDDWDKEWSKQGGPPEIPRNKETVGLSIKTETILNKLKREYDCTLDEALDILTYRYSLMELPKAPSTGQE